MSILIGESSAIFQVAGGGRGEERLPGSRSRVSCPPSRNSARIRPTSPLEYITFYRDSSTMFEEGGERRGSQAQVEE